MRTSVSVTVDVEVCDVLSELSDGDLLSELRDRNVQVCDGIDGIPHRARECIRRGTLAEACALLAEIAEALEPAVVARKLKTYRSAQLTRDPVTHQPTVL